MSSETYIIFSTINALKEKPHLTSNYYPGIPFTIIKTYTKLIKSAGGIMFLITKVIVNSQTKLLIVWHI
jgi:hypothetical protein